MTNDLHGHFSLPFTILAAGRFIPATVRVSHDAAPRETTPELDRLIADQWERQCVLATQQGRLLFNGPLLRYVRHEITGQQQSVVRRADENRPSAAAVNPPTDATAGGSVPAEHARGSSAASPRECGRDASTLRLTVGPTCYRDFAGTNLYNHHRVDELGWHRFANPVGTTATLVTSDDLICYGRRSAKVAYHARHVHTFGGALEERDRAPDGAVDPFASLCRELMEELGLDRRELLDLCCVGLIRDKEILQPEMLFEARLRMTAQQLRDRWTSAEARDEHDELVTLPDRPEAIVPFVRSCGPIAPVAIGALMLHGLYGWGEAWLQRAATDLTSAR